MFAHHKANEIEGRLILQRRRADVPFPRSGSLFMLLHFGPFKGKGNGG